MTMTLPSNHGSQTLDAMFKNCATAEQTEQAADKVRGPFQIGEVTAFVFYPSRARNDRGVQLHVLDDTGLAGVSEGGRMEVDQNELGPEEFKTRAQDWFKVNVQRGKVSLHDVVAVAFDSSRSGAPELSSAEAETQLKSTLEQLARPTWGQRFVKALKEGLAMQAPH